MRLRTTIGVAGRRIGKTGGMAEEPTIRVADNPEKRRYEIFVDDTLAGFATYRTEHDHLVILHSEVFPEFEHHGLASRLAGETFEDLRRRGLQAVLQCPYFRKYVREHREYGDLVMHQPL